MPACLAVGCTNKTGKPLKDEENPKSFHQIPDPTKNHSLCARWLNNMANAAWNINNFEASRNRVLCSDHFHSNCFARDLMTELLDKEKFPQRKKPDTKLVEGAIPTIFKHKVFDEINMDGTKILLKESASRKRSSHLERKHVSLFLYTPVSIKYIKLTRNYKCGWHISGGIPCFQ